MSARPDTDQVAVAEAAERRQALEDRWKIWQPRTIPQLIDTVADEHPDRPYVLTDERAYSYADIAAWSVRLAAGLASQGIGPGDHVAVDLANFPETVALKYAVGRLGATTVSINFLLRQEELGYVLRQSRAKLLITMDTFRDLDYLAALDGLAPGWESGDFTGLPDLTGVFVHPTGARAAGRGRSLDALVESGGHISNTEVLARTGAVDPHSVSDLLYTSGTTGAAKGAMLTHDGVLRTAYASAYTRAMDDGYRIGFAMPIYHVFGYVEATMSVPWVGGAICPKPTFDAADLLGAVGRHQLAELMAVPAMTAPMLDEARSGSYDLGSLTTMFSSGAAHRPGMFAEMKEVLGVSRLFTAYGQTETTASTTCVQPGDSVDTLQTTLGCHKPAGIAGDPALGGVLARYKVVGPQGEELPPGEIGALIVRGPIVTRGYFDKPAETAELIDAEGWLHTGDLGSFDEYGYIRLTGRKKESYRCGGELVLPSEVEEVLSGFPGVAAVHVVGIPHDRMGEVGCAWIVPADPGQVPEPEALIAHCKERLARFKVPAAVLFTAAGDIPMTVTGRVKKFELVARAVRELSGRRSPS
ncbi:AMP-binding protein [Sporichthya polymorpha]|uniref:AMP-binding protein n=1 Tax=Sporichthya polymorpha TaxID=35751 RepID=UPI001B7FB14B|nr:AMP-binding protein [Sporichthya polymorpha]